MLEVTFQHKMRGRELINQWKEAIIQGKKKMFSDSVSLAVPSQEKLAGIK